PHNKKGPRRTAALELQRDEQTWERASKSAWVVVRGSRSKRLHKPRSGMHSTRKMCPAIGAHEIKEDFAHALAKVRGIF
ncbi:MAG TPA: hypothetical protein VKF35_05060, partial [Hyphomicrobiaceae bacterium]|nr:hypothetical protein [Hyphomicrobiaceae bacterium]